MQTHSASGLPPKEIIFRTADFALRFGAASVSCYSYHPELAPTLLIENSNRKVLRVSVRYAEYVVRDDSSGEEERTNLYLHVLALIRTHCDLGEYEIQQYADYNLR
jgi:hypothetical protein